MENVVVITGKLISLPYGLKAGLNSKRHYQQFYFLLLLLCTTPSACLCWSLCFYFFLSTLYSFSFSLFSLTGPPLPALSHIFKAVIWNNQEFWEVIAAVRIGHDMPSLDSMPRKNQAGSDLLWVDHITSSPNVVAWLKEKKIQLTSLLQGWPSTAVLNPGYREDHPGSYLKSTYSLSPQFRFWTSPLDSL